MSQVSTSGNASHDCGIRGPVARTTRSAETRCVLTAWKRFGGGTHAERTGAGPVLVLMRAVWRECTQGCPRRARSGKKGAMGKSRCTISHKILPKARIFPINAQLVRLVSELRAVGSELRAVGSAESWRSGDRGTGGPRRARTGVPRRARGRRRKDHAPDDSGRGAPNPPAISCSRIFLRPRCSRDITVPTGVPMISAISRYG